MNQEFTQQLIDLIFKSIEDGTKKGIQMIWSAALSFITMHWELVMGVFLIIFIIAITKILFGRWGMLGSVVYNLLYFGTLFVIGLIWGSEIFISDYFKFGCAIILYPLCYLIVGFILKIIGVYQNRY